MNNLSPVRQHSVRIFLLALFTLIVAAGCEIKLVSDYTYQGPIDRDGKMLEQIDVQTQVSFLSPPAGGLKLKQQDQQGTLYFDARAGRLVESRIVQELRTERQYRDQKIEVQTKSTTTLQVK